MQLEPHLLQVEDDVGHVLAHPGEGRELVQDALHAHGDDCRSLQRRQQHAAKRVADRRPVAAFERLPDELAVGRRETLFVDLEAFGRGQITPVGLCDVVRTVGLDFRKWHNVFL